MAVPNHCLCSCLSSCSENPLRGQSQTRTHILVPAGVTRGAKGQSAGSLRWDRLVFKSGVGARVEEAVSMTRRFELSPTSLKHVRSLMFGGNYILIERHQSVFCFSTDFFSFTFGQFANPTKQRQGRKKKVVCLENVCFVSRISNFLCRFFFFFLPLLRSPIWCRIQQ